MLSKIWKGLFRKSGVEADDKARGAGDEALKRLDRLNSLVVSLSERGKYQEAIEGAILSVRLTRQILGEQHPNLAKSLNNLAMLYYDMQNYTDAERLCQQSVEIWRKVVAEQNPFFDAPPSSLNLATVLNNLALMREAMDDYATAESFYQEAMEIKRKAVGEQSPKFANSLNNLAMLYLATGRYTDAERLNRQALEIRRKVDERHPDYAQSLNNLAMVYHAISKYAAAEPLYKQALEIWRKLPGGEQRPNFANSLNNLAELYVSMGKYEDAKSLCQQALEIRNKLLGKHHPDFAQSLNNLAALHQTMGNYEVAEPLCHQALEIRSKVLGKWHPDVAQSLNNLATLCRETGRYLESEPLYQEALEIYRKLFGKQHPDCANVLDNLATLHESTGNYVAAEPLCQQALEIRRKLLGEEHPDFAVSLICLAGVYKLTGKFTDSEPLYRQALEIWYKLPGGEQHPHFATSLNDLAVLYHSIGDCDAAGPLYEQALEIRRKVLGEHHPDFAASLNNLAALYKSIGRYKEAVPLCQQASEIWRTVFGEQSPDLATSLNSLALLYKLLDNYQEAERLYQEALENRRKALGEQSPTFAVSLNNLAMLYQGMGSYEAAEPLCRQALEIWRNVPGSEQHPDFVTSLKNLVTLLAATDREEEAKQLQAQMLVADEQMLGQVFSCTSERQRSAYLGKIRGGFNVFLSLVKQSSQDLSEVTQSALSLVLRRKAIEAEALAIQRDAVLGGKYPEVAAKLGEITMLRAQIAQKTLAGPGKEGLQVHQRLLAEWNARKERLEAEAARQVPEMNIEQKLRSIDRQVVAMALPKGATLVEFVRFNVYDFKAVPARGESQWKPARYLAFVMPAGEPDSIEMIDLGEAESIDRMIATFRESITGEEDEGGKRGLGALPTSAPRTEGEDVGLRLREAIFDPLLKAIGDRRRLLISPDGNLSRLPFEVLPTDDGRRLIDEYRISYLGAGRDVVRFGFKSNREPSRSLVAADPDFNFGAKPMRTDVTAGTGRRSRDLKREAMETFERLPGTRLEGENIARMLDAELWTGGAALDARLKQCQSPRILHLATHGFFLEDQKRDPNDERFGLGAMSFSEGGMQRLADARFENPLLRSGLALAGVNTWLEKGELMEEAEDGLLTAEDVSGLDLLDTDLVVLSACDTGLGEVRVGEGVFGLRRAFVLAGAKTLVMSLWKVPDEQTRQLMEDFYRRILGMDGNPPQSRVDALREAQLAMKAKHPEPLYWGAFICQGYDGPLAAS